MDLHRALIVVLTILIRPFSVILFIHNCLAALAASLIGGWGRKGSIRVLEIFKKCFRVISLNKPSEKWLATRKFGGNPFALGNCFRKEGKPVINGLWIGCTSSEHSLRGSPDTFECVCMPLKEVIHPSNFVQSPPLNHQIDFKRYPMHILLLSPSFQGIPSMLPPARRRLEHLQPQQAKADT